MLLSNQQLEQYRTDGFLILRDFFTDAELQPVIDAINDKVMALANKLYASGMLEDRFENEGFLMQLTKLELAFRGRGNTHPHGWCTAKSIRRYLVFEKETPESLDSSVRV